MPLTLNVTCLLVFDFRRFLCGNLISSQPFNELLSPLHQRLIIRNEPHHTTLISGQLPSYQGVC